MYGYFEVFHLVQLKKNLIYLKSGLYLKENTNHSTTNKKSLNTQKVLQSHHSWQNLSIILTY